MEKNNNGKVVAIVALVVAVVALSVGFAAFADQLLINGTAVAKVSNNNPFDNATTGGLRYKANTQKCTKTGDTTVNVISTGYSAGTLNDDSWTGINVPLTEDIPSVTCTATIENLSSYKAWLKSIGADSGVGCTSSGSNATANASSVCSTVNVTVQIGSVAGDTLSIGTTQPTANSSTTGAIEPNQEATATVTISYTPANAVYDEDVTITLPTITHDYSSVQ